MDISNRQSIMSGKSIDLEFPYNENLLKSRTISPQSKFKASQTFEKFLQLEQKNKEKSMVNDLQNIQLSETSVKTNQKGSIYSRYSRNRDSVSHLFSLLRPERIKSSIFTKKNENSQDGNQNALKDSLLTDEQLIEVN